MPSVHMCAGVGNKSLPSSGGFHSPEILFVFVNTTSTVGGHMAESQEKTD